MIDYHEIREYILGLTNCCPQNIKYISHLPEMIYTVTYIQKFLLTLSNNIFKWQSSLFNVYHVFYLNQSLLIVA